MIIKKDEWNIFEGRTKQLAILILLRFVSVCFLFKVSLKWSHIFVGKQQIYALTACVIKISSCYVRSNQLVRWRKSQCLFSVVTRLISSAIHKPPQVVKCWNSRRSDICTTVSFFSCEQAINFRHHCFNNVNYSGTRWWCCAMSFDLVGCGRVRGSP